MSLPDHFVFFYCEKWVVTTKFRIPIVVSHVKGRMSTNTRVSVMVRNRYLLKILYPNPNVKSQHLQKMESFPFTVYRMESEKTG